MELELAINLSSTINLSLIKTLVIIISCLKYIALSHITLVVVVIIII